MPRRILETMGYRASNPQVLRSTRLSGSGRTLTLPHDVYPRESLSKVLAKSAIVYIPEIHAESVQLWTFFN